MDPGFSRAVKQVFVSLYDEGLIYRDYFLVNRCPHCRTVLSDIEIEHKDLRGKLWHIRYPVEGSTESVVVATTRPETMLGDTALAVHPDDERYARLHGRRVIPPLPPPPPPGGPPCRSRSGPSWSSPTSGSSAISARARSR